MFQAMARAPPDARQGKGELDPKAKNPGQAGVLSMLPTSGNYLILASLYMTCLRATGSYFFISSWSGVVRLFLSVV